MKQSVLVITGMHRSGTSFTASLLQSAGLNIGQRLLEARPDNVKGFFENIDFLEFHQMVLKSQTLKDKQWTIDKQINVDERDIEKAKEIIAKNSQAPIWGWKDPRTTLFLDFWESLLPEANFLLIYRSPWEVVDSLYRRGEDIYFKYPHIPVKTWIQYNQKLIEFYDKFPNRCLLASVYSIAENTQDFIDAINAKFQLNLGTPSSNIYDESLLNNQVLDTYRPTLVSSCFPETLYIYRKLNIREVPLGKYPNYSWLEKIKPFDMSGAFQDWINIRTLEQKIKKLEVELERTQIQTMPNVSVIIPTYQRADLVSETIESVLAQTYTDYEIIVVNDGSTDNTREVLAQFKDKITVIHQENKGLPAARNTGIIASRGRYIAFVDDDDLWIPYKLEKQVACFESNPNIGLVYSNMIYFKDNRVFSSKMWPKGSHPSGVLQDWMLFMIDYIPVPTVVVRRECFDEVGLFDETLTSCEDYDLWLRIIEKFPVHFLNEPVAFYRLSTNSMSKNKERMLVNEIRVQEKAFSRNPNLKKLDIKLLDQNFYSKYLTLAHFYIDRYQGEKARLVLEKYRQARGINSIYEWLWIISFPALNSSLHL
ncbi:MULTISPECIES: glycosyltransferase [unclassified Nostoc]|uniref:glycosyltransferase n=1 Tax=unclassified Nostoc TaxID=2593658 RepID=UPI002AD2EFE6|nr:MULTISPECIES: glycosyltransferase [unclassified Nostoc]MDZ8125662.1 glycosyltransferase [Nostoc sp. CmiVER01]MDZ8221837.1 glycosyltransferase [Nostoc sp. ChiVER01]